MPNLLRNRYTLTLGGLTLFVFILNALFPLISDDFCHLGSYVQRGGIEAAIRTYMTWNARVGEIFSVLIGTHLVGLPFAVVNTFVFAIILFMVHPLLFARKGETSRDGLFLIIFFTLLSISTVFGAVFLWRAGAMNYAWSIAFCLMHFTVFRYYYAGVNSWYNTTNTIMIILFSLLSFLAGMSSFDLGALGCIIHVGIFIYRRINKHSESFRFLLPAISFIAGFIALYTAPSTQIRADSVDDYTSLGQIISWVLALEFPQLAAHYLDTLGRSMYKTNYVLLLASLATTYFITRLQARYHFMPLKRWHILSGYFSLLLVLIGLLFSNSSKPSGDSLGAIILFSNLILSIVALIYLLKNKTLITEHYTTVFMIIFFHCLMLIDASAYTVGVVPARRAYLTASALAALTLSMIIEISWTTLRKKCFFIPIFIISATFLSLETWGLYITNKALITTPRARLNATDDLVIHAEHKLLKAPQFYDWSQLSTNKNHWANRCFVSFNSINKVSQAHETTHVSLFEYIDYLGQLRLIPII